MQNGVVRFVPGICICALLATAALLLAKQPFVKDTLHLGALLLVILAGMAIASFWKVAEPFILGVHFCQRAVLRWAVAGLGFKLSLVKLGEIGGPGLVVVIVSTVASMLFGFWIADAFRLDRKLGQLLGIGTSICGASAIVAADSVVQSEKSDVACSLGLITLMGTIGIIVYPPIGHALSLTSATYSLWNGASLHELAQVVAAGQGFGQEADILSTSVKLARICLLAPVVFWLAWSLRKHGGKIGEAKVALVPWFLVAFLAVVALNTFVAIPSATLMLIQDIDLWLLCLGMAGVGLNSGFHDVKSAGWGAVWVALIQWIALAALSLGLALAIGQWA